MCGCSGAEGGVQIIDNVKRKGVDPGRSRVRFLVGSDLLDQTKVDLAHIVVIGVVSPR